jgi:hypothetical protein
VGQGDDGWAVLSGAKEFKTTLSRRGTKVMMLGAVPSGARELKEETAVDTITAFFFFFFFFCLLVLS